MLKTHSLYLFAFAILFAIGNGAINKNTAETKGDTSPSETVRVLPVSKKTEKEPIQYVTYKTKIIKEESISVEDIKLLALLTMAEAEGESEEGQRFVIDTVLNRVDSEYFPDTIQDVIHQPYQFSPMWNGRIERCEVKEELCRLVREELAYRTDYNVMFFTAGGYSKYGIPMFQVGNHYFSSYN